MAKILVTDGIEKSAADEIRSMGHELTEQYYGPEELKEHVKDFDAVIVRSATKITRAVIDGALETGRLKLVVRAGVGVDNIDVRYANINGIKVENTPDASSAAVAELAVAHMFALARYIYASNVTMRNGLWNKKEYEGVELAGKTLGLIGFGRIARETAKRAAALGMRVVYYTHSGKKEGYDEFSCVSKEELLKTSDFISLHIPYDKEKGPEIDKKEFEMIKEGAYLINCARGGVVNEEALLDALDSNRLAAAALDVFEQEPVRNERLFRHPKVSLTPHIGASTVEAQARIGKEIVGIVRSNFCEENIVWHSLNLLKV